MSRNPRYSEIRSPSSIDDHLEQVTGPSHQIVSPSTVLLADHTLSALSAGFRKDDAIFFREPDLFEKSRSFSVRSTVSAISARMDGDNLRLSLSLRTTEIERPISTSPSTSALEMRSSSRWIDMNRMPTAPTVDVDDGVSSPNISGGALLGGKRPRAEGEEIEGGTTGGGRVSDEEEGETTRKKLRLTKEQSAILEDSFKEHSTLNPKQKIALAKQLNLRPRQVEVWFQNRRARTKLKQTEVDCEFLKRCCENLTEENRRLQRELLELRALKRSPHFYMPVPATTLTMCPSCERVEPSDNPTPLRSRQQIRL